MALTPYERETIIGMNDEDDFAIVTTYQRPVITKLKKNPSAELVWELAGAAQFKIPAKCISFRQVTTRQMSEATRAKLSANVAKARAAKGNS